MRHFSCLHILLHGRMKVTVFGSCRQESLHRHFDVTKIREELTYPHYSREIIQAIEFCKGISNMEPHWTQYMFRTGILRKTTLDANRFLDDFKATDLFVLEIASRIAYEYKGMYAHHILSEEAYGFEDRKAIVQRELSDEEIEQDVLRIRQLLDGKPFIVVTHICTRTSGKRYELVQLLKRICRFHSIPLFDPSEQASDRAESDLYVKEDVLAHYTPEGHRVIGEQYKLFIEALGKRAIPIETLTVFESTFRKERVGSKEDGGYVIADLSEGYDALFACGISNDIRFELAFLKKHPIPCFAFDGTVEGLPDTSNPDILFHKRNIGNETTASTTNLHKEIEGYSNIFLKMDIETFEYRWLQSLTGSQLKRFKQITMEFHFPFTRYPFNHLDIQLPVFEKMSVFHTLTQTHTLIHFHANNCCGTTTYQGTRVPNVFECTFLRKDIQNGGSLNTVPIPSPLDHANLPAKDIQLTTPPFVHPYFAPVAPVAPVVLVLQSSYSNFLPTKTDNFWGFGDMLRGIATCYMACKLAGRELHVDLSRHPIARWFYVPECTFPSEASTVEFKPFSTIGSLVQFLKDSKGPSPVFLGTNGPQVPSYSEDVVAFVKRYLTPNKELSDFIASKKPRRSYSILHMRLGDRHLIGNEVSGISSAYETFLRNVTSTDILLCDSPQFKQYVLNNHTCGLYDFPICHVGVSNNAESLRNTLFEYFIASKATSIKTYSVYGWRSGFVDSIHKLFNIPIETMR